MISEASAILAGSVGDDAGPQAQSLERMQHEFLAAQQRRRDAKPADARPDDTDDRPLLAGPADGSLSGLAAARPCH
jgi:hypothetical protein